MRFPWKSVCTWLLAFPHLPTIKLRDRSGRETDTSDVSSAASMPNEEGECACMIPINCFRADIRRL